MPQDGADCIRCGCLRLDQQRAIAGTGRAFTLGLPCEVRIWSVIDRLAVALVHSLAMPAVYPIRGPSAKILPFRTDWNYLRRRGANAAQMPYMLPIGEEHTDAGSSLVMCQKLLSSWSCLDDHHGTAIGEKCSRIAPPHGDATSRPKRDIRRGTSRDDESHRFSFKSLLPVVVVFRLTRDSTALFSPAERF